MRRFLYSILLLIFVLPVVAQNARDCIRLGNAAYRKQQYDKAETYYLKSIAQSPSFEAHYNLGNAYIMQQKDSAAFENYKKADSIGTNDLTRKALNFHNMGNIWYAQGLEAIKRSDDKIAEAFQNAVYFYKNSLRCNPNDNETRYNLAMAQYMLKKYQKQDNGGNGGGGNGNNDNNQDNKKDEKNKQDKQEKQDKQDGEGQQGQQKSEQKKDEMSDQTAEQLLNSAQQDEKNVQDKVNQRGNNRRRQLEKDW